VRRGVITLELALTVSSTPEDLKKLIHQPATAAR